ncbi:hypothetical protein [Streptomyces olivochromogenes]|uniref:hypothetical protein n=1 Tax=Streptomyces olivochromogenes TaxID=1963 RepID=UPI001F1C18B5|nr:hypothetical protein [Streptomyces olivochromogenes]MCF3137081.1 hypothetical protein [Streptomyces olivochromogenes]
MSNSATDRPKTPDTVWPARGRHIGPDTEDVLRRHLRRLKENGVLEAFTEPPAPEGTPQRVFEARWRVAGDVIVRARLTLVPPQDREDGREWVLMAEAERPWDEQWPSPATMFWPDAADGDDADTAWDHHHSVPGLRFRAVNPLPSEDKAIRRLLRNAAREAWCINLVVHEAMTPDELGRLPLARLLPPSLRHRVVEHRAAPQQLRAVNWAIRELGVWVPRGGAVLLPPDPAPPGYDGPEYSVRDVFLDGSEHTELVDVVRRFAALPKPLPQGADEALTDLRENWTLLTLEEELARERRLVAIYAEALDAMTKSRDLYRDAAEQAHQALAAYRDTPAPAERRHEGAGVPSTSPLQQLTRTFERLRGGAKGLRQTSAPGTARVGAEPGTARDGITPDNARDGDETDATEEAS